MFGGKTTGPPSHQYQVQDHHKMHVSSRWDNTNRRKGHVIAKDAAVISSDRGANSLDSSVISMEKAIWQLGNPLCLQKVAALFPLKDHYASMKVGVVINEAGNNKAVLERA